ncbi:hypothetical protein HDU97_009974 [Phlyctochytrium planicorne]|nr:hypothetical protein HDU97_009974 [Phlyctochytrium planicorne]
MLVAISLLALLTVHQALADQVCNTFSVLDTLPYNIAGFNLHDSGWPLVDDVCACARMCQVEAGCIFFSYHTINCKFTQAVLCSTILANPYNLSKFNPHHFISTSATCATDNIKIDGKSSSYFRNLTSFEENPTSSEDDCKKRCFNDSRCRYSTLTVLPLDAQRCQLYSGSTRAAITGIGLNFAKADTMVSAPPPQNPENPQNPQPSVPVDPQTVQPGQPAQTNAVSAPNGDPASGPAQSGTGSINSETPSATGGPSNPASASPSSLSSVGATNQLGQPPVTVTSVVTLSANNASSVSDPGNAASGSVPIVSIGLGVGALLLVVTAGIAIGIVARRKIGKTAEPDGLTNLEDRRSPSPQQSLIMFQQGKSSVEPIRLANLRTPTPYQEIFISNNESQDTLERTNLSAGETSHSTKDYPSKVDVGEIHQEPSANRLYSGPTITGPPPSSRPSETSNISRGITLFGSLPEAHINVPVEGAAAMAKSLERKGVADIANSPPRSERQQEMLTWSPQQVASALILGGVAPHFANILEDNRVNGYLLLLLNEERLERMSIEPQSARLLILTAVNILIAGQNELAPEGPPLYS